MVYITVGKSFSSCVPGKRGKWSLSPTGNVYIVFHLSNHLINFCLMVVYFLVPWWPYLPVCPNSARVDICRIIDLL